MTTRVFSHSPSSVALRARLGLSREELGLLLGVSAAQVGHVEVGRRGYSARVRARLLRLLELLPPAAADPAPAPAAVGPAHPSPAEAAALHRRLRACRRRLRVLREAQVAAPHRAARLAQRRQALAGLAAALDQAGATTAEAAREQQWLELLHLGTRRREQQLPSPTALGWQALRLELLAAEIAGLEALLAGADRPVA